MKFSYSSKKIIPIPLCNKKAEQCCNTPGGGQHDKGVWHLQDNTFAPPMSRMGGFCLVKIFATHTQSLINIFYARVSIMTTPNKENRPPETTDLSKPLQFMAGITIILLSAFMGASINVTMQVYWIAGGVTVSMFFPLAYTVKHLGQQGNHNEAREVENEIPIPVHILYYAIRGAMREWPTLDAGNLSKKEKVDNHTFNHILFFAIIGAMYFQTTYRIGQKSQSSNDPWKDHKFNSHHAFPPTKRLAIVFEYRTDRRNGKIYSIDIWVEPWGIDRRTLRNYRDEFPEALYPTPKSKADIPAAIEAIFPHTVNELPPTIPNDSHERD